MATAPLDYCLRPRKATVWRWAWALAGVPLVAAAYFYARPHESSTAADTYSRAAAQYQLQGILVGLLRFKSDTGRPPTIEEGSAALTNPPPGLAGWRGPYIEKVQSDPWGRPYQYKGQDSGKGFLIVFSAGPDGIPGTPDDVSAFADEIGAE